MVAAVPIPEELEAYSNARFEYDSGSSNITSSGFSSLPPLA